ncbi:MAG: DNA recombination protein RmuC [Acidiferrobacteraceae bacterium]
MNPLVLAGTAVIAAGVGWAVASWRHQRRLGALEAELTLERTQTRTLEDRFARLSQDALERNRHAFLDLATEKLREFRLTAEHELGQREQAVEHMVKPIREALDKTEQQLRAIEHERIAAYAGLSQELKTLTETHRMLQGETRQLAQALRQPQVRGRWGEMTLKRLAELAGMVEHCDFFEQESVRSDGVDLRPDMVIRMPGGREVVLDAKTPLDAYLKALEATDDSHRADQLRRHALAVRDHVRRLSGKAYWNQFANAPDFVVMFIPGDQFLGAALDADHRLLEDALAQQVILATPTSLVALLRAIAFGWRQRQLEDNAGQIRKTGEDLYARLAVFSEHLAQIGRGLESGVNAYNNAIGSFERKLLPGARRFVDMGVGVKKVIDTPVPVETNLRSPEKPDLPPDPDTPLIHASSPE